MRKLILVITILLFAVSDSTAQSLSQEVKNLRKGIASFYHNKFEGRKTATGDLR